MPRNTVANTVANASDEVTFTITVSIANVRSGPGRNYAIVATAEAEQAFYAIGRNAESDWLRISNNRQSSPNTWVYAALGDLSINIERLPVVTPESGSATPPTPTIVPTAPSARPAVATPQPVPPAQTVVGSVAGLPSISARARQIYANGAARGRNPTMFMVAGDSNSENPQFYNRVSLGWHGLSAHPNLPNTLARWSAGAQRQDTPEAAVSVRGGLSAAEMVKPFSHPNCAAGENRYTCELRLTNASVVFIQLGTGDKFAWREFDANLRNMIDYAIAYDVLPVLVTKADNIEAYQGGAPSGYLNSVIRALAGSYQLPLIDFDLATSTLPTVPNPDLPRRPFTQHGLLDEWGYYFHLSDQAKSLRVLMTLLTLGAIG